MAWRAVLKGSVVGDIAVPFVNGLLLLLLGRMGSILVLTGLGDSWPL